MTIDDILERCKDLPIGDERVRSLSYAEIVFYKKDVDQWQEVLAEILGPVAKSAGEKTAQDHFKLVVNHGGLFDEQTLYYKKFEENSIVVMFWPWRDEEHVTLKIINISEG